MVWSLELIVESKKSLRFLSLSRALRMHGSRVLSARKSAANPGASALRRGDAALALLSWR
jgi:hypothetical protein